MRLLQITRNRGLPAAAMKGILFSCAAIALCGCQVPSALWYRTVGPPPIPARYKPPQEPLLILVENVHSGSQALPEADDLAMVMHDALLENHVAPLIDPATLHEVRDAN